MLESAGEVPIVSVQLRRWSRQEYDRMIDAGVLTTQDRVELSGIPREWVRSSGREHVVPLRDRSGVRDGGDRLLRSHRDASFREGRDDTRRDRNASRAAPPTAVCLAETALRHAFGERVHVRSQLPLALDAASEPEPDVAVVAGSPRDYRDAHPSTALLIVEVADTSLEFDRTTKASLYARAGIPDYWLVNLVDARVEVHRNPQRSTGAPAAWHYTSIEPYRAQDRIAPLAHADRSIAVEDLLP